MTKVTINKTGESATESDSPSQQLIKQAIQEHSITDRMGRKIVLRKPPTLSQFRLIEAVGDSARNQTYMAMILPLNYVSSIDGAPVPGITSKAHLEALIQRLDDEGVEAVMTAVSELYGKQDPEADKAYIKNS